MHRITALIVLMGILMLPVTVAAEDDEAAPQPAYYELRPALIANLAKGGKYIRCDVQLMTMDGERMADIELHAPAVRHQLLMLMTEQDGNELRTPEGKEELRRKALEAVRAVMRDQTGRDSVDELFFTAFFVQ